MCSGMWNKDLKKKRIRPSYLPYFFFLCYANQTIIFFRPNANDESNMIQIILITSKLWYSPPNSINGILTIVTLNRIPFPHRVNTRSHLISPKSAGLLFNSTVLSGHREEHWQDLHSCTSNLLFECTKKMYPTIPWGM